MIPKIIHLCWISGKRYPSKIRYCIKSWKKYNPDYEIMLWDASSFDFDSIPWTREAMQAGKYAFVADYIRLYAVYNYGGIYLDSDVEVLKSFDNLLDKPYFLCTEAAEGKIELAAFGAEKGTQWVKDALDYYDDRHFINEDGSMNIVEQPKVIRAHLDGRYGFVPISDPSEFVVEPGRIRILPIEWFCAHYEVADKLLYAVTENTYCVHHFTNSWVEFKRNVGLLHRLYYKLFRVDWEANYPWFPIVLQGKKRK